VTVTITDDKGALVSGATVTVAVEYRRSGDSWSSADDLSGTTTSSGALQFDSGFYRSSGGDRVDEIRFRVVSVTKPNMSWQANTSAVTANRPN
jgi:hypothetical protein